MATMFGRFEILSELSKSEHASIYKATDKETNQSVALKTLSLEPLGEHASAFVEVLLAEGEATRDLSSQNIALLYGAGEIDGQFCAAMEYVQGNSVRNMLARREGFSIWDLLDITRQFCAGLEHAATLGVVHQSLEPAKIMVQWDGLVKILGYGVSSMSLVRAGAGAGLGPLLPYCSPEQVRGDAMDVRSNLFTLGTILYEMVADRPAFDAADPETLTQRVLNDVPPAPATLNPKVHRGVSALVMKALAKDPQERYQSAGELIHDLELCKESGKKSAETKKPAVRSAVAAPSAAARAEAASKFVGAKPNVEARPAAPPPARPVAPPPPEPTALETESATESWKQAEPSFDAAEEPTPAPSPAPVPHRKAARAAAGAGTSESASRIFGVGASADGASEDEDAGLPAAFVAPVMSAAAVEPPPAEERSAMVDPIMAAAPATTESRRSFSDIDELPPMKEPVYQAPPPPPEPEPAPALAEPSPLRPVRAKDETPRIQPREVAEKALNEIKTIPPKLMIGAILGAVCIILVVAIGVYFHVRSEDDGSTAAPRPTQAAEQTEAAASAPAPTTPAAAEAVPVPAPPVEQEPEVTVRQIEKRAPAKKKALAPAPVAVIPGQVQVDSNPQGAQIQIDGRGDPSWVTPFNLTVAPGQHTVAVSKSGYNSDSRVVTIAAGSKAVLTLHLAPVNALLVLNSTPAGASVILDGKDTGRVTPVQFAIEKGPHTVVLRKQGYLDETSSADLASGQNMQFNPALRELGNVDEIKSVGKFKKLFGGNNDATAGMGTVSIRTQPKGAQIAINRRLVEKPSPAEFMLGPGNYIVDVTLTGFKPIHKVITVEKGGKVAIDEILERE